MNAKRLRKYSGTRSQALSALLLAFSVLPWGAGPATPVHADASPDPVARLQVDLTETFIYNDRDLGEGEMKLTVKFIEQGLDGRPINAPLALLNFPLKADDNETVPIARYLPGDAESRGVGVSADAGIPVYAGHRYALVAEMVEIDTFSDDKMGAITAYLDEGNNWGAGPVTLRSIKESTGKDGDFNLSFEVKRAPLPDLRPSQIRVSDAANSTKRQICTTVSNDQGVDAGAFDVDVRLDGSASPVGVASATSLGAHKSQDLCIEGALPPGPHNLIASVDSARALPEANDANNVLDQSFTVAPAATPTPTAQADLTLSAIKINGRPADGKDDCKDGKNKVAVVVKNIGTANAGEFVVRLVIDPVEKKLVDPALKQGTQPSELVETVTGLEAGQEEEVRFDDVRLKQGQHVLVAFADLKETVSESKEDNNELRVTASCKDDD